MNVKTWMLILIIVFQAENTFRYFFIIPDLAYDVLLISSAFLYANILFLICYYFAKKSSQFLEDSGKIKRYLRYLGIVTLFVFIGLMVY